MKPSLPQAVYDTIADSYAAKVTTKPHNTYYDRPAVLSLLPSELKGKNILDAGCGTGVYAEILLDRGAQVIGLDANANMLRHARHRLGSAVVLHQANLEESLDFLDDAQFDGVVSALTLTYIEDLVQPFTEFARVLKPGGWLVFSTEHPFFQYQYFNVSNYFNNQAVSCTWSGFDTKIEMPSFYHSLGSIFDSLNRGGFVLERLLEAKPTQEFKVADPKNYEKLQEFPAFITMKCIRAA